MKWMQGFRKVDPDRWEFANEGFLRGQRHLLKTIKRRRNVAQSIQQQGGGACVELGQYGFEGDLDRLRRDRTVLMAEIVRLRQQQQNSRGQLIAMETRLQSTEKKQQQILTFLAKALNNPTFVQQLQRNAQNRELQGVEIRRKRRLTASPSLENLQEDSVTVAVPSEPVVDYAIPTQEQEEFATMESEIETFFSAAYDNESSSEIKEPVSSSVPSTSGNNLGSMSDAIWEDLLNEDLVGGNPEEEVVIGDAPVEDMVAKYDDWSEGFQDIVDQMGYLGSKP